MLIEEYLEWECGELLLKPAVDIIIPSYDSKEILPLCLNSIKNMCYDNFTVTVIDDASTDGTAEYLERNFRWVNVISNKKNLGPSESKNLGIKNTKNDLIITLDSDAVVTPHWLDPLVEIILSDKKIGACGPKLLIAERAINSAGAIINILGYARDRGLFESDIGQYDKKQFVLALCSAACLYKREVIKEVGMFDSLYFYPFEDVDLGWRMNMYGYQNMYVPQSTVYHKFGYKMGTNNYRKQYLCERNRLRTVLKNYEATTFFRLAPAFFGNITRLARESLHHLINKDHRYLMAVLKAFLWNLLHLRSTLLERQRIQKNRKITDEAILKRMEFDTPHILFPDYIVQDGTNLPPGRIEEIVMGKSDDNVLGYGWYKLEPYGTDTSCIYRRTKDEATAYLNVDDEEGTVSLEILSISQITGKKVCGTVVVNNISVGQFDLVADNWREITFEIGKNIVQKTNGVLKIALRIETTWKPGEVLKTDDKRILGVGVRRISWKTGSA